MKKNISSNNSVLLFFVLLSVLGYIVSGHSYSDGSDADRTNDIIDQIIAKNYLNFARHVDTLKSSGELPESSFEDYKEKSVLADGHLPGYDCQHDHVIGTRKIGSPKLTRQHHDYMANKPKSIDELNQEAQANVGPIRINFDTTYLYNSKDPRVCYKIGQKIKFGTGTAGDCRTVNNPNCLYTCESEEVFSNALANLIEVVILPTIRDVFAALLSVQRVSGNLVFTKTYEDDQCDNFYPIPQEYFSKGVANTDMLMFITARPTYSTSTIATALACIFPIYADNFYGRPTAAGINFNPLYFKPLLSNPNQFLFKEYIRVGIHEATHALGFSRTFYDSFVDSTGNRYSYTPSYNFVDSAPVYGGSVSVTRAGIRTPNVVNFIKDHYNCASLKHQLLEDAGGAGTAGSHWEKRTVGEEYMIGYVQPVFPITGLTLALLKDSGWYTINNTYAEPLMWGRKLGCDWFAGCTPTSWSAQGYFASELTDSCTPTRVGKGTIRVYAYTGNLPEPYRHFSNATIGGADPAADYCPFADVTPRFRKNAYCVDEANQNIANNAVGEYYGTASRCFEYTSLGSPGQACWKYQCTADKVLQILVKSTWVTCNTPGQTSQVEGITVRCPKDFYICDFDVIPIPGLGNETILIPDYSSVNSGFLITHSVVFLIFTTILSLLVI